MSDTWVGNLRTGDVISLGEFLEADTVPEYYATSLVEYAKDVLGIDFLNGHATVLGTYGCGYVGAGHEPYTGLDLMITGEHDDGSDDLPYRAEAVTVAWPSNERATLIKR